MSDFHEKRLNAEWDYQETKVGGVQWLIYAVLQDENGREALSNIGSVRYEAWAAAIVRDHNEMLKTRLSK